LTVEADTDEYLALLASVQLKGIMWMLLQHREQLGHKTITRISVFKDEVTGEVGYDALHRGPCVYIELGDVQSGAGNTGAGPSGAGKAVAGPSGSGPSGAGKRPADGPAEAGPSGDRPAKAAKIGRVRRDEKPPSVHPSKVAPRCNARYNSNGNATAIKVGRVRRADKSLGGASGGSGSGGSGQSPGGSSLAPGSGGTGNPQGGASLASGSGGSDRSPAGASLASGKGGSGQSELAAQGDLSASASSPPLHTVNLAPYIRQGALAATYMRASDEVITADLVQKGKLKSGERIASQFTDHSAFKSSGREEADDTEVIQGVFLPWVVPFSDALQSLGISNKARPAGKLEYTGYVHTLPWVRNGQSMQVSGCHASQRHSAMI
jgi:hypothetical protein